MDRFTSNQDQNDHQPILHIVKYNSPAKILRFCDICLIILEAACQRRRLAVHPLVSSEIQKTRLHMQISDFQVTSFITD